jgi:hypothetical protein
MQSRREALKIIGAVGVTCAFPFSANELYGQHVHQLLPAAPQEGKPGAPFAPKFFTPAQFLVVSRLSDLIIPPTETPGAAAAGLQSLDRISQSRFSGSGFLQLTEAQQVEILTSLSEAAEQKRPATETVAGGDAEFFRAIKNLTADGYYTSRIGLMQELGYNGDAVLAAFPAVTVPEH